MSQQTVTIDLRSLYGNTAKLALLPEYEQRALALAGEGNEVILTGQAPVWLYLNIAHALHGKAKRLIYRSPVTEDVVIFDHDPGPGRERQKARDGSRRKTRFNRGRERRESTE
jgi:hypothetical protein